jgi:hypothetical protein
LSNTEIAERMNVKKATVEHYMVMALNHLRSAYKEMYRVTILLVPLFLASYICKVYVPGLLSCNTLF